MEKIKGFVTLMKLRVVELLLVTTVPTMIVAEEGLPSIFLILATLLGGTLSAGGANAINMFIDRDIDPLMERTRHRPLVTGILSPAEALTFAIAIEALAFLWLWLTVNLLSAVLAVGACLFYVFIYSLWLKRTSSSNIVIGGAAGAAHHAAAHQQPGRAALPAHVPPRPAAAPAQGQRVSGAPPHEAPLRVSLASLADPHALTRMGRL